MGVFRGQWEGSRPCGLRKSFQMLGGAAQAALSSKLREHGGRIREARDLAVGETALAGAMSRRSPNAS